MQQLKRAVCISFSLIIFALVTFFFLQFAKDKVSFFVFFMCFSAVLFCLIAALRCIQRAYTVFKEKKQLHLQKSATLTDFIQSIHFSYTYIALIRIIRRFEKATKYTVVFSEQKLGILYTDWERTKPAAVKKLDNHFKSVKNGFYFFNAALCRSFKNFVHGFALKVDNHFLFVFFPSVLSIHALPVKKIYEVFEEFIHRAAVYDSLSNTALLAQEWSEIEKTQYSFLPKTMPHIDGLKTGVFFLPLANVSGDYYLVLPLNKTKTLILLGDVSGKGLAAALVMGVVINAVKAFENKENVEGIIESVDTAIKLMHLQDKYTVLFVGLIDTAKMELHYVNASMADSLIIRKQADKIRIRELSSNCTLLGIVDVPLIETKTEKLVAGDLILLSSDGVSEIGYSSGGCFGETQLYRDTLKKGTVLEPQAFAEHLAATAIGYGNNSRLRDDITILTVRVLGAE